MPTSNPADTRTAEEVALGGVALGFFGDVRRSSPARIQQAIRQGSIQPIVQAPVWQGARERAVARATPIQTDLAAFGLRSGLREVPRTTLVREVAGIAPGMGELRAVEMIQGVDARTRETISALVRTASAQYQKSPSLKILRELAANLRPLIGLTPKQATTIARARSRLLASGVSGAAVDKRILDMTTAMINRRAALIADRAVIEDVSAARHRAWELAEERGELNGPRKTWRDQGDGRVRTRHHTQTLMGPIPLGTPYPVFGVQHPPAPESGCRCWEVLVVLPELDLPLTS